MKWIPLAAALLAGAALAPRGLADEGSGTAARPDPLDLQAEKYELPNGLDVILYEDHRLPMVAVNVWYHVGSKNEEPRRTGFAHVFEHMMFQGSEHHDTDYFVPLESAGAFVNGSTTEDRTNYLEDVPSSHLELALWLESDRMGFLLPAMTQEKFENQRSVVMNERRQSVDNEPYGCSEEMLLGLLFPDDHPYAHSVIGWMGDLEAATLEDVQEFFRRYYTPNNASLCLAGDFETAEAKALIEKYFASLPPGPPVRRMEAWVPVLDGVRRATAQDAVTLPRLYMAWHTPPRYTREDADFDLIANVLASGKTSRLYEELVYNRQIAQDVTAYQDSRSLGSIFNIQVTAKPGLSLDEIETAVDEILAEFLAKGIRADELAVAQAGWEAGFVRRLQTTGSFGGLADAFNGYNTFLGDPNRVAWDRERYTSATPKSVMAAARAYLRLDRRAILRVVPQGDPTAAEGTLDRSAMPAAGLTASFTPPRIQTAKLENGLELYLVEDHRLPLVQALLMIKSGWAADPPERPGAAALTAAMLDEGTRSRSALEISETARGIGAQFGTSGAFDNSGINLNVLSNHLDEGLDLLTDVLLNPTFPSDELERLRQQHLGRIQQDDRQPFSAALKVLQRMVFGLGHPYAQPYTGTGTVASIHALQRQDLVDYYTANYRPNNAAMVLVGDITLDEAKEKLAKRLSGWKPQEVAARPVPPMPRGTSPQICIIDRPGAPSSMLTLGWESARRKDQDYLALEAINSALGGYYIITRLNMNLREDKGLTYAANTQLLSFAHAGAMVGYSQVDADKTADAVREFVKEIRALGTDRPIVGDELVMCRNQLAQGFPQQFQTVGAIAGQLAQIVAYGLPLDEWQTYMDRVNQLDEAALARAVRNQIHGDRLLIVIAGDREKIEPGLRELGLGQIKVLSQSDLQAAL